MTFGQKSFTNFQTHNKMEEILKRLEIIEKHVLDQNLILKNVLNFNEACKYLELSQSHLYKLTSAGSIPHYKPNGKKLYFNREELDQWLLRNRNATNDEIEQQAADYLIHQSRLESFTEEWIDGQDVMQTLHISKRTLQSLRDSGTLPYSRINGKFYYKLSDLESLMEKNYSHKKSSGNGNK